MKNNSLKRAFSALAIAAVAASASSMAAFADEANGFTQDQIDASETKPVVSISVDGNDKGAVYSVDEAKGKTVTVALKVDGAQLKYASTGFHVYYSDKLTLATDPDFGTIKVDGGKAIQKLSAGTPKEDPTAGAGFKGVFVCTAGDSNMGINGEMWTFEFTLPADAAEGDVYPIDIIYKSNENAEDLFVNTEVNQAGQLMQAYTFTRGIYNTTVNNTFAANADDVAKNANLADIDKSYDGYIAVAGGTTTTETTTTTTETTTTTTTEATTTASTTAASTTTGSAASTAKSSSTASGTGTTKNPKTGVSGTGAGLAVAGLAVAVATAFVLRKKED